MHYYSSLPSLLVAASLALMGVSILDPGQAFWIFWSFLKINFPAKIFPPLDPGQLFSPADMIEDEL
jgi:hypothetical protein